MQFISVIFSLFILVLIFELVRKKKIKEEYSILWFIMDFTFIGISLNRNIIDIIGNLFGIAYAPILLVLIMIGFIFLILIHFSIVISRLTEKNKELTQEIGLLTLELRRDTNSNYGKSAYKK